MKFKMANLNRRRLLSRAAGPWFCGSRGPPSGATAEVFARQQPQLQRTPGSASALPSGGPGCRASSSLSRGSPAARWEGAAAPGCPAYLGSSGVSGRASVR